MSSTEKNRLLTPAAKETLENLVQEYAKRILEEALIRAQPLPSGDKEVSVRDILESADRINQRRRHTRAKRLNVVLQIYGILGILMVILGMAFLVYENVDIKLNINQQVALSIVIAGLLLALSPLLFRRLRRVMADSSSYSDERTIDSSSVFIKKWQDIENALRLLMRTMGPSDGKEPISAIIQLLYSRGIITELDVDKLRLILKLRNEIVHEDRRIEADRVLNAINQAEELLSRLSRVSLREQINQ